jgi:hypothetical protein
MRIEDMPRPWLLAAITGVPMSALLRAAEQQSAERAQTALRDPPRIDYRQARPTAIDLAPIRSRTRSHDLARNLIRLSA